MRVEIWQQGGDIRVLPDDSGDMARPFTIWWTNHEWSDMTVEEARRLFDAMGRALAMWPQREVL
mgnify:CR=1 FL=1